MSSVTCHISMSLDGFVAGPNQSVENPIGEGGTRLHKWVYETASWREQHGSEVADEVVENVGAYVMGRKMFGRGVSGSSAGAPAADDEISYSRPS